MHQGYYRQADWEKENYFNCQDKKMYGNLCIYQGVRNKELATYCMLKPGKLCKLRS